MAGALVQLAVLAALASPAQAPVPAPPGAEGETIRFESLQFRDRVEGDGTSSRTTAIRIRLGSAAAVAQFGQVASFYLDGYGEVRFEDVVVEKPDGRRVELKDPTVEDVNPLGVNNAGVTADLRVKKITIPGLEPGDVLSYRVEQRNRPLTRGRYFGELSLAPVPGDPLQVYELDLPRSPAARVTLREGIGAAWEDVVAAADRQVRRLQVRPTLRLPTDRNPTQSEIAAAALPDVSFSSFGSWNEVGTWWWSLAREPMRPTAEIVREAAAIAGAARTPEERLRAVHAFVAGKVRYVNVGFGIGRMQPRVAADVLATRYGDCKDKMALLVALASALGVDVRPALVNTTRSRLIDEAPGPQQFDHVIGVARLGPAAADWLWLDPTNPYAPAGYLAEPLRDKRVLLVEPSGDATPLRSPADPPYAVRTLIELRGALESDGALRGHVTWTVRSDAEVAFRLAFDSVPPEKRAALVKKSLARDWADAEITKVVVSDPLATAEPLRIEFDAKQPAGKALGELAPPLPSFNLPKPADPFPPEGLLVGPVDDTETLDIQLPEGVRARAPLSLKLERPFARYEASYSAEDGRIRATRRMRISQKRVDASESAAYESFRKSVDSDGDQKFAVLGALAAGSEAAALRREGLAAFEAKDYGRAVEDLRTALEKDPKLEDGWQDLGKALSDAGKHDEALAAFERQVDAAPFHGEAYAWKAYELEQLGRPEEAEKALEKQIEVAPFAVWSYEKLAWRRMTAGRYGDAAEMYGRAAAIEPRKPGRWVDVAWARVREGKPDEARAALEQARPILDSDWLKVRAAEAYAAVGDTARAGELAEGALPALTERLARLEPDRFSSGDAYYVERLAHAWRLVGRAALAAGQLDRAARYLDAAWRLAFLPDAAWGLGELRVRQSRPREALELWTMASAWTVTPPPMDGPALPADWREQLAALRDRTPAPRQTAPPAGTVVLNTDPEAAASAALLGLRTVSLGPAVVDASDNVLVLVAADGTVEAVHNVSRRNAEALDRQIARLRRQPLHVPFARPDDRDVKVVRRAVLACSRASACALVLDLPGGTNPSTATAQEFGKITIVSVEPTDSIVKRGGTVPFAVKVRYELTRGDAGEVRLVVQDDEGHSLAPQEPAAVTRGEGELTLHGRATVPARASRVDLFVSLQGKGAAGTSTVDVRHYSTE